MTTTIFTIGHSLHTIEHFLALLDAHEIGRLVDVRSQPCSRHAPHFDAIELPRQLDVRGIEWAFLGNHLGGRPIDREFYRPDGTVDYERRAAAPDFQEAIRWLVQLSLDRPTAILCAEEDPERCHRRLLVAPALVRAGLTVTHIRGDGRLEPHQPEVPTRQIDLFGGA